MVGGTMHPAAAHCQWRHILTILDRQRILGRSLYGGGWFHFTYLHTALECRRCLEQLIDGERKPMGVLAVVHREFSRN